MLLDRQPLRASLCVYYRDQKCHSTHLVMRQKNIWTDLLTGETLDSIMDSADWYELFPGYTLVYESDLEHS